MRVLDLFCGSGGATYGYMQQWPDAEYVGVDIDPEPLRNYPGEKVQADALDTGLDLASFDLIHASPPCQEYSASRVLHTVEYPKLVADVRDMLDAAGVASYVIENVEGPTGLATQPTLDGRYGTTLCGTMFGLQVRRHRVFETTWNVAPGCCYHERLPVVRAESAHWREQYRDAYKERCKTEGRVYTSFADHLREDMGLDGLMSISAALESFPPAYTAWLAADFDNNRVHQNVTERPTG